MAPLLHRGFGHFLANIVFIHIASPVESGLNRRKYISLLLLAGYVPVYADGVKFVIFGHEPHVAVYGASAFAFGLLAYEVGSHIGRNWELTPRQWLIVVCGLAAVAVVIKNGIISLWNPISLHLGHLGGASFGIVLGYIWGPSDSSR
ncbi:rhomboid family intramembrane serine protease [Salinirubellus salinus]|uniref:rhomboid family intramembrane serine protease n=1 Tax=Salinirubellus salinus TaxID=1364945 RepID=UPI0036193A55